jgi:hypothetical protein
MILLQLLSDLLYANLQSFLHFLTTSVQRANDIPFSQDSIFFLYYHQLRNPLHCPNIIILFSGIRLHDFESFLDLDFRVNILKRDLIDQKTIELV